MTQLAPPEERTTQTAPLISVCILSRGPGPLLRACLESLRDQVDPPSFEVLVGSYETEGLASQVRSFFPEATVEIVVHRLPGAGRNFLIGKARGTLLLFVDDDVETDPHLLARLARLAFEHPDVGVFGGPNLTPPGSSSFQIIQGAVLGSIVAAGPIRRRYGAHPSRTADERSLILCNLAIRTRLMRPFQTDLACAEENQLLLELKSHGVKMHYDPSLIVYHERRSTPRSFIHQIYKYGYGRGQVLRRNPGQSSFLYLVPSAFCLYGILTPALLTAGSWTLLPLAAYLAVVLAGGAKVAWSLKNPGALTSACALIVALHAAYGLGVMVGVAASTGKKSAKVAEVVIETEAGALESAKV